MEPPSEVKRIILADGVRHEDWTLSQPKRFGVELGAKREQKRGGAVEVRSSSGIRRKRR